jgi:hypothetical protein
VPFRESAAPPELRAALARKGGPGHAGFDGAIPGTHEEVSVDATSSVSPCQSGFAKVVDNPTAFALLRAITGKPVPGVDELGSLLPSTPLLQYEGTPAKGASGAAVTRNSAPDVVVAVHVAGLDTGQVSWGVLLPGARAALDATVLESRLGEPVWPGYRLPKLPQSSAIPDGVRERIHPWVPGVSAPSLALFVESGIWRSPYRPVAFGALASHALLRFASETDLRFAWGVRLQAGYVGAHVPERTLGPDGSTLFDRTRLVHGVVLGASPELELRPTASLRPAVGLGARLRTTRLDVDGWSWAFPVYGRVALSVSQRWSLGLEGWVALEKGASRGGRLTGFGARAAPLPRSWGAVAGAAGSCSW